MSEQWDPNGVKTLVIAIMEQGVTDVLDGDPGAIAWLDSRGFDHWCAWLGIDATAARQSINVRRVERQGTARYTADDLRRVIALHDRGVSWQRGMIEVFGYYSETTRAVLMRYEKAAAGRAA